MSGSARFDVWPPAPVHFFSLSLPLFAFSEFFRLFSILGMNDWQQQGDGRAFEAPEISEFLA